MKVVALIVFVALFGLVRADEFPPTGEELQAVVGPDAAATLQREPESAQEPVSAEDCLANCNPMADPNNMPNVNSVKREMNDVSAEMAKAEHSVKVAEQCAKDLEGLRGTLANLMAQKSDLADMSKKTLLESKVDLEERSSAHVGQMIDTLSLKLSELQQAEKEMQGKQELTRKALDLGVQPDTEPTPPIVDAGPTQSDLATELNTIHKAMVDSLDSHNKRIFDMSAAIPGLHDLNHKVLESHGVKGLEAALDKSGAARDAALTKALEGMDMQIGKGLVSEDEKKQQVADAEEVEDMNKIIRGGEFKETRELSKLRKTIRKLKRKLGK